MQAIRPLKSLKVLHITMLVGWSTFAIIAWYLVYTEKVHPRLASDFLLLPGCIALAAAFALAVPATFVNKMKSIRAHHGTLMEKFIKYRSFSIKIWAFTEALCFISILCYFLEGRLPFIIVSLSLLIYVLMITAPTSRSVARRLGVEVEEVEREC
jgi:hypothetical protein